MNPAGVNTFFPALSGGDYEAYLELPICLSDPVCSVLTADESCAGFHAAMQAPEKIMDTVKRSGIGGRGGSGFSVYSKWKFAVDTPAEKKYIVCNCSEGEPGTGKDRALLLRNAIGVVEGIAVCAAATGADTAYLLVKAGDRETIAAVREAVEKAGRYGLLSLPCGTLKLEVADRAFSYVCGEETGALETLEGRRAEPRPKPPFPGIAGLYGMPTVINNAETFANIPLIFRLGAERYASFGTERSTGTRLFTVTGCVKNPGIYELPFGVSVSRVLEAAGGACEGSRIKGVLLGGRATGMAVPASAFDLPLSMEGARAAGFSMGTGAMTFFDEAADALVLAENAMDFLAEESCGKCASCRLGTARAAELLRALRGPDGAAAESELEMLLRTVAATANCGLGQAIGFLYFSLAKAFPAEFVIGGEENA